MIIVTHPRDRLIMNQYSPEFIGQVVNRQHSPAQGSLFFVFDTSKVKHGYQIHISVGVA